MKTFFFLFYGGVGFGDVHDIIDSSLTVKQ